jgi:hypothetical protein
MATDRRGLFDWNDSMTKPVISSDGRHLGSVDGLEDLYLIVKDGSTEQRHYWIPRSKVNGYHDEKVWLAISEEQVKSQFARRNAGYHHHKDELEMKFLAAIYEETLSRKSSGENTPILLSITNIASDLGFVTKGSDKQELFSSFIDSLAEKGLVERYAANAVAITSEGIETARDTSRN